MRIGANQADFVVCGAHRGRQYAVNAVYGTVKSDLADSALAGVAAFEEGGTAAKEQYDVLLDKGRDLVESAADLIRERPIAAFGTAFAAGWIIAKLARSGK